MTDGQILDIQEKQVGSPTPSWPLAPSDWIHFARAIESAACAPLLERIAELTAHIEQGKNIVRDDLKRLAERDERIAELEALAESEGIRAVEYLRRARAAEAKLAQRVPDGWAPSNAWQIFGMDGDLLFIQHDEASANRYKAAGHRVEQLFMLAATPAAPEHQECDGSLLPHQPSATDLMIDAYLAAQRLAVEEADRFGRPNFGCLHTNTVREACRAGLNAALEAGGLEKKYRDDNWWKGWNAAIQASVDSEVAQAPNAQQAEPMSRIAKTKLADLIAKGYRECGVMIEMEHSDGKVTRGAVSNGGMVIWWHPEQMEADHTRAQQAEAQPVAWRFPKAGINNGYHYTESLDGEEPRFMHVWMPLYIAQPKAVPLTQAASDVLAERQRQISAEGWTPEHDDEHDSGELAAAASAYALAAADAMHPQSQGDGGFVIDNPPPMWPWSRDWWKPSAPRCNLVKATAMAIAEIERWDRAHTSTTTRGKP